jgi:hypothetical protein
VISSSSPDLQECSEPGRIVAILADHDGGRIAAHLLLQAPRSTPGGSIAAALPELPFSEQVDR